MLKPNSDRRRSRWARLDNSWASCGSYRQESQPFSITPAATPVGSIDSQPKDFQGDIVQYGFDLAYSNQPVCLRSRNSLVPPQLGYGSTVRKCNASRFQSPQSCVAL